MKIVLLGYGKMGNLIEKKAVGRGHSIHRIIDDATWTPNAIEGADVAIEFSNPESAKDNILKSFEAKVPIVVGTTGWYNDLEEIKNKMNEKDGAILPATNFSLGVNIFFEVNRVLAKIMNKKEEYAVGVQEIHHTQKLDSPSGTAITTANILLDEIDRYDNWQERDSDKENSIAIEALRKPDVPGTHTVSYESDVDQLAIKHTAKSRDGFALGAVIAAEFLKGTTGYFTMKDLIKL